MNIGRGEKEVDWVEALSLVAIISLSVSVTLLLSYAMPNRSG